MNVSSIAPSQSPQACPKAFPPPYEGGAGGVAHFSRLRDARAARETRPRTSPEREDGYEYKDVYEHEYEYEYDLMNVSSIAPSQSPQACPEAFPPLRRGGRGGRPLRSTPPHACCT